MGLDHVTVCSTQKIERLESETKHLFHYRGVVQKHLDDIEDGLWKGKKVAAWNTLIFPCSEADDQTIEEIRKTYNLWLKKHRDLEDEAKKLHDYYTNTEPCRPKQHRLGSVIYQLELGKSRLIDVCTTARTGIPFSSWANRHAIRCLDPEFEFTLK